MDSYYNDEPTPPVSQRGGGTAGSALPPAPASSHSPTLPTRSIQASRGNGSGNTQRRKDAEDSTAVQGTDHLSRVVTSADDDIGPYTQVRTSVSFAPDEEDSAAAAATRSRPPTPTNTDSSTLRTSLILSQSFDKNSVDALLLRFKSLPKSKRSQLLRVLADLEASGDEAANELKESIDTLAEKEKKKTDEDETNEAAENDAAAPPSASASASDSSSPPAVHTSKLALLKQKQIAAGGLSARKDAAQAPNPQSETVPAGAAPVASPVAAAATAAAAVPSITLRILGNWGHPTSIGSTLIEFFDAAGTKIRIPPSSVHCAWSDAHPSVPAAARSPSATEIAKLFTNKVSRALADEKQMWSMVIGDRDDAFPMAPHGGSDMYGFEIALFLPSFFPDPTRCKVWNWNRPMDLSRGIRRMEILVKGVSCFKGEIAKGLVDPEKDSVTKIPLREDATFDDEEENMNEQTATTTTTADEPDATGRTTIPSRSSGPSPSPVPSGSPVVSSRPLWLQGSATAVLPQTVDAAPQPAMLGHSSSAAALSVGRRRTMPRDALTTAQGPIAAAATGGVDTAAGATATGSMIPPLLSPTSWSDLPPQQSDGTTGMFAPLKRPMSGRRAGPIASTATGTGNIDPNKRAAHAHRTPVDQLLVAPSPAAAVGGGSSPSSLAPSPTMSPAPTHAQSTLDDEPNLDSLTIHSSSNANPTSNSVKKRSDLDESWDSLEHFRHHHHGRLPQPPTQHKIEGADTATGAGSARARDTNIDEQTHASTTATLPTTNVAGASSVPAGKRLINLDDFDDDLDVQRRSAEPILPPEPLRSTSFVMPSLPSGRRLTFSLLSTYGDSYYIGLSGIELFDGSGRLITFADRRKCITASPSSVNVLPGVKNDPRIVSNLLDGCNATCDDFHLWLAPYSKGKRHIIVIDLPDVTTLSFMRIWNYNKSRIHTTRGVKEMEVTLDSNLIFKGQLSQAPGNVAEAPAWTENILWTTDARILARVAAHTQADATEEATSSAAAEFSSDLPQRPPTAGSESRGRPDIAVHTSVDFSLARPKTSAHPLLAAASSIVDPPKPVDLSPPPPPAVSAAPVSRRTSSRFSVRGSEICFYLVSTWGDAYFCGLTGLELFDSNMSPIPLVVSNLSAYPQDINTVPGHSGDNRTLDKLINSNNVTTNDNNMWLAPKLQPEDNGGGGDGGGGVGGSKNPNKFGEQWLKVRLSSPVEIAGFRVWNYNKSEDDTYRGMKWVRITIDGTLVTPKSGFLFRKAPGNNDFDFGQTMFFKQQPEQVEVVTKEMRRVGDVNMPVLPCGLLLKFLFLSSWNDPHYIGLNGLEIYDHNGKKVPITMRNVSAVPSSLNDLNPSTGVDTRTVDKLFDGVNDTFDDRHMWLAPILPSLQPAGHPRNALHIFFDAPIAISAIKIWNYSKTPARGVAACQILLDDVIIHDGHLRQAPLRPTKEPFGQTIIFSPLPQLVERESQNVLKDLPDQDVLLVNERKFMNEPSAQAAPNLPQGKTIAQVTAAAANAGKTNAARPKTRGAV